MCHRPWTQTARGSRDLTPHRPQAQLGAALHNLGDLMMAAQTDGVEEAIPGLETEVVVDMVAAEEQ